MKLKFKALALVATMFAAPAFAADFDVSTLSTDITAVTVTEVTAANNVVFSTDVYSPTASVYDQNVALLSQVGDGNFVLVDQSGGTGNFAGVLQDATTAPGVAVVVQAGNFNRAHVNQH